MKTLTAFRKLLLRGSRKSNVRAVSNHSTWLSECCMITTVSNESNDINDAKQNASFLFYGQATINDQMPTGDDSSSTNDQKLKNDEDHDNQKESAGSAETASGDGPASVYDRARWRVNDDLAACIAVNGEWSWVSGRWPGVNSDWQLWNKRVVASYTETTNTGTKNTRTNQNDALLPFASFSFFFHLIFKLFKFIQQNNLNKDSEPVFVPVRICDKSNMHFPLNRFNKKNQI